VRGDGGTRGVQPHFRARNALRGLNIIPREYVTRVNLRPRTPSRSTGLGGGRAIYSALNAATFAHAAVPEKARSPPKIRGHANPISRSVSCFFFPARGRDVISPFPPFPPSPPPATQQRVPAPPRSACASFSLDVSGIVPATTPEQNDPRPRLSTSATLATTLGELHRRRPRHPRAATSVSLDTVKRLARRAFIPGTNVNRFRAGDLCGVAFVRRESAR